MATTRVLGKNAVFKLEESDSGGVQDISADGNEITLNLELNNEDGTGFGVDWRESSLIDGTFSIDYSAFYAGGVNLVSTVLLGGNLMANLFDKRDFEFYPNGVVLSAAAPKYAGSVFLASAPVVANRGSIVTIRARLSGASQLTRVIA